MYPLACLIMSASDELCDVDMSKNKLHIEMITYTHPAMCPS